MFTYCINTQLSHLYSLIEPVLYCILCCHWNDSRVSYVKWSECLTNGNRMVKIRFENSLFSSFALVALLKRAIRSHRSEELAKWADRFFTFSNTRAIHSLWKSDLLFLRVGKLNTGLKNLYHTFWLCFKKKIERITLFLKATRAIALITLLKRATRAILSFTKSERAICSFLSKTIDLHKKPKSKFPTLPGPLSSLATARPNH